MKFSSITLVAAFLLEVSAAAEVSVNVYEGPTECEDDQKVKAGDFLSMHYTGTIDESSESGEKGKQFDSSRDRGDTFDFQIGSGQVIAGWDEGIQGLCVGAKATLVIPPEKGYGEGGAGEDIPGGATLNFDVEVVGISDEGPEEPNLFNEIDTNGDGKLDKEEVGAYFSGMGSEMPEELWDSEDQDKDGFISWDEFSGPKGEEPEAGDDEDGESSDDEEEEEAVEQ